MLFVTLPYHLSEATFQILSFLSCLPAYFKFLIVSKYLFPTLSAPPKFSPFSLHCVCDSSCAIVESTLLLNNVHSYSQCYFVFSLWWGGKYERNAGYEQLLLSPPNRKVLWAIFKPCFQRCRTGTAFYRHPRPPQPPPAGWAVFSRVQFRKSGVIVSSRACLPQRKPQPMTALVQKRGKTASQETLCPIE